MTKTTTLLLLAAALAGCEGGTNLSTWIGSEYLTSHGSREDTAEGPCSFGLGASDFGFGDRRLRAYGAGLDQGGIALNRVDLDPSDGDAGEFFYGVCLPTDTSLVPAGGADDPCVGGIVEARLEAIEGGSWAVVSYFPFFAEGPVDPRAPAVDDLVRVAMERGLLDAE